MAEDWLNLWQKLFTRALSIPEGEIDFIVSAALTSHPAIGEEVLGRAVMVETSAEIIAKKIWHRSAEFAARDVFDFALVMQKEPQAEERVKLFLSARREVLVRRLAEHEIELNRRVHGLFPAQPQRQPVPLVRSPVTATVP